MSTSNTTNSGLSPRKVISHLSPDARKKRLISKVINLIVLVLAVALIVYISVDTFQNIEFLKNTHYMTFQLWVCIAFMAAFFIELKFADDKRKYLKNRWLFFLLSIPYLNIISLTHFNPGADALYFLRFIPLARGGLAIAIIVSYFTRNKLASVFFTYTSVLLLSVYFCSLIIFKSEQPVNPQMPDFGEALWFAFMVVTTIGCNIAPVTIIGKILQFVLASMGMIMFPLFTVYITNTVIRLRQRDRDLRQQQQPSTQQQSPNSTPSN